MESIEQPVFDSLAGIGEQEVVDTADRTELIEATRKKKRSQNGDSPNAENSPLHKEAESATSILCSPQNYGLRVIIVSSIVFSLAVTVALILTIYLVPQEVSGNAAVVCGDARCASLALQALKDGGNAVDAAVTAAFCLAVVEPQHSGLGGGGFAIVHDHKFDNTHGYDFRETAPALFTPNMLDDPNAHLSMLSSGVPGMLKGMSAMHKKHGKLPWKDVVEPSIELARTGFSVSEDLAQSLQKIGHGFKSARFIDPTTGQLKTVNDTVILPNLAATLGAIKTDADALYTGSLKTMFAKEVQNNNGKITEDDLETYSVVTPTVLQSKIKDLTMLSMPPPAGGPLLALVLNMAQKFAKKPVKEHNNSLTYHRLIETFKFGFGQYSLLGDPSIEKEVNEEVKYLLSDALASELVAKMTNQTNSDPSHYGPTQPVAGKGTSHISVLDSSEVMVSMSLSTGDLFGNEIMSTDTGIFLNNNLMDFSLSSQAANDRNKPLAKKRPQSTMCPTIIYNKDHPCDQRLIIGGVHGPSVITGLAQVVINNILYDNKLSQALAAPRLHNQLFPNYTQYETDLPQKFVTQLISMGHDMRPVAKVASEVTAVRKSNDDITTGVDPRSFSAEDHY